MKANESTAISTAQVILVPYRRYHVETYHGWMEDPAIRDATASERLTLEEEYENQESWRTSHDKLTFIILRPLADGGPSEGLDAGKLRTQDFPPHMVGDVNFFLYHRHEDADDEEPDTPAQQRHCVGEVDVMIASVQDRGKGLGKAAVKALLHYVICDLNSILEEYSLGEGLAGKSLVLSTLMVKINQHNSASIALFKSLGFEQEGDINYFGEVKLVLSDLEKVRSTISEGYSEIFYPG